MGFNTPAAQSPSQEKPGCLRKTYLAHNDLFVIPMYSIVTPVTLFSCKKSFTRDSLRYGG